MASSDNSTTQYTLSTTPTRIAAADSGRQGLNFQNTLTLDVYLGNDNSVSSSNYAYKVPGNLSPPAMFDDARTKSAYYAVLASGTGTINVNIQK